MKKNEARVVLLVVSALVLAIQVSPVCSFSAAAARTRCSRRSSVLNVDKATTLKVTIGHRHQEQSSTRLKNAANADLVDSLLNAIDDPEQNSTQIVETIRELETGVIYPNERDELRYEPLLGLYSVAFTKTTRPNDNPVGGKWTRKSGIAQKLLRTKRTFQHILKVNETGIGATVSPVDGRPIVGEAVNVVGLEALFGLVRVSILLRGDCIALNETQKTVGTFRRLSPWAVQAFFDAPRICVGNNLLNINVGPKTSVLLDATYVDSKIRIGMGGTSGTRFVFARCDSEDTEANEFRGLLRHRPLKKWKAVGTGLVLGSAAIWNAVRGRARTANIVLSVLAFLWCSLIGLSSGGIERDGVSRSMRRAAEVAAASTS